MGETGTIACAKIGPVSYLQVTCSVQQTFCAIAVISLTRCTPHVLWPLSRRALTERQAYAHTKTTPVISSHTLYINDPLPCKARLTKTPPMPLSCHTLILSFLVLAA